MRWPWNTNKERTSLVNNETGFKQIDIASDVVDLDENSPTWKFIKKFIEEEIADLHTRNESLKVDTTKTAFIRGEISAFRKLAALPKTIGRGNTP